MNSKYETYRNISNRYYAIYQQYQRQIDQMIKNHVSGWFFEEACNMRDAAHNGYVRTLEAAQAA